MVIVSISNDPMDKVIPALPFLHTGNRKEPTDLSVNLALVTVKGGKQNQSRYLDQRKNPWARTERRTIENKL